MFNLKIEYKGKIYASPKENNSFIKIQGDINTRYPGEFPNGVVFLYQANILKDYHQILQTVEKLGLKSIKISIEPRVKKQQIQAIKTQPCQAQQKQIIKKEQELYQPMKNIQQNSLETLLVLKTQIQQLKELAKQQKIQEQQVQNIQPKISPVNVDLELELDVDVDVDVDVQIDVDLNVDVIDVGVVDNELFVVDFDMNSDQQNNQQSKKLQIKQPSQPNPITDAEITKTHKIEEKKLYHTPQKVEHNQEQTNADVKLQLKVQVEVQAEAEAEVEVEVERQEIVYEQYVSEIKNTQDMLQISTGIFRCMFCIPFQNCKICDGHRVLNGDSKFVKMIQNIVDRKVTKKMEVFMKQVNQKIEIFTQKSKKLRMVKKNEQKLQQQNLIEQIDTQIVIEKEQIKKSNIYIKDAPENNKQFQFNEQISWKFEINLDKELAYRHKVFAIEQKTGEMIDINLANKVFLQVGPYKAEANATKCQRTYRLYLCDGLMQAFGPKFGFSAAIAKIEKAPQKLTSNMRLKVDQVKKQLKISKTTQFLIEGLKQMGISEQTFDEISDMLPDILGAM